MSGSTQLKLGALCLLFLLLVYVYAAAYIKQWKINWIHHTGVALLLGLLFGYIFWVGEIEVPFSDEVFFYYILPPIIFGAGYNMKRRRFINNMGYILLYGVLGTVVSFIIIGALTMVFSGQDWIINMNGDAEHLTINDALALGSVLAASDVVAVLTIINEATQPRLHALLFGEGITNDAIAIILFKAAQATDFTEISAEIVLSFVGNFLYNCILSILLGTVIGLLSSWVIKVSRALKHEPVYEISVLFFIAYIGYILGEICHISGVITLLTCSILMGHFSFYNLSVAAQHGTTLAFELLGHTAEGFVFAYLGLTSFAYGGVHWSPAFIGLTLANVMFGRVVHVFLISGLLKLCMRKNFTVTFKEQGIIWLGGGIRGAVAFALILGVKTAHDKMLITTTLGLCVLTTVLFGMVMPLWCWICKPDDQTGNITSLYWSKTKILKELIGDVGGPDDHTEIVTHPNHKILITAPRTQPRGWLHQKLLNFQDNYLRPCLLKRKALRNARREQEEVTELLKLYNPLIDAGKEEDEDDKAVDRPDLKED